ncbi:hypothetical protein GCM10008119_33970 [Pedobacter mendelii]|uniref:Uncharacterized protein n=1 Tax=Pedobacter mendelii TaxID=1908240 RepID=A0ABQ2BLF4_9SPHI|nr:hypothetical protein GCM10008119_33970 [Pedobacter mendelii]
MSKTSNKGEEGLNSFRDKAKQIADELDMKTEFDKMNKLVSAMLTTKPANWINQRRLTPINYCKFLIV